MAPRSIVQDRFGGGIFRARRAPADSVYDAINALVNDERELFRRAGSTYRSTSNAASTLLTALHVVETVAGQRVMFGGSVEVLDAVDAPLNLGNALGKSIAVLGPYVVWPNGGTGLTLYAGSLKTGTVSAGTVTVTNGSKAVTGVGTTWLTGSPVDKGMILDVDPSSSNAPFGVVDSVSSNTALTLVEAWTGPTAAGQTYALGPVRTHDPGAIKSVSPMIGAAGDTFVDTAGGRLLRARGNRMAFSAPGDPFSLADSDYHELPRSAVVTGLSVIDDTAILFTTTGAWAISNLALDALDDAGNVQHSVQQINKDVLLWSDPGIAAYQGALIVPAVDDVWAFSLGAAPVALSEGIRPYYRELVEAGYRLGMAVVYRGHYILPVLDGSSAVVDVLVCRLDLRDDRGARRPVWTRWANHAAGQAYAVQVDPSTARTPKLLGVAARRVTDLTGCFDPDATRKDDADGTDHQFTVTSNDVDTGPGLRGNTVLKAVVDHELVDAAADNPTATFATATGAEGSAFTTCTNANTGGTTAPESDGSVPAAFAVVGANGGPRKAERIRWRWQTTGAAASAILRRVKLEIRPSGRQ